MKAASSCQISLIWTYSQNQLFDSGVDFHKGSLQISARWNPLFLQIFLKFCHIHSVEIGSNFVFCHSELLLFLNVALVPQKIAAKIATRYEIPCGIKACLRCTAICGHKFPINRGFIWQSTHFLPENTWSDTSHILRIYFSGSEISIRLMSNQTYDTKKK